MDLNHDGILSVGDSLVLQSYITEKFDINELQKSEVTPITKIIKKSKTLTGEEMLEALGIHSGEITYDETEELYYLTLKKSYTYKELSDMIKNKYGCSIEYWDENTSTDISNQSTEVIKSGTIVFTERIYYENIVGDTSYIFDSDIWFEIN